MPTLYLNNDAVVKFTNKLEQLSHTALPNVVKETLNFAALDVKQKTMPKTSEVFAKRNPKFFTGNSKVDFVKSTHNINEMVSAVGFSESKLANNANNFSVKELEEQELGGTIGHRTFIPLPAARQGNYDMGLVLSKYRLSEIRKKYFVEAKRFPGKSSKEKFTKAAVFVGVGGFVIGTGIDRTFLYQITKLTRVKLGPLQPGSIFASRTKSRSYTKVESIKLYEVKPDRSVNIHETDFMEKASEMTEKKLEKYYIAIAKVRFERELKL